MYEQDYLLRLIHEIVRTVLRLVLHITLTEEENVEIQDQETSDIYRWYVKMIDEGKINEAENQLFDSLDAEDKGDLLLALLFYEYLANKDEAFLEANNYKRDEIVSGIKWVAKIYECEGIIGTLMNL